MKVKLIVDADDNFTVGNCRLCPISMPMDDVYEDTFYACPLWRFDDCPIEVVEK